MSHNTPHFCCLRYVILAGRFPFGVPDGPREDVEVARVLDGEYGFPEGFCIFQLSKVFCRDRSGFPKGGMELKLALLGSQSTA